jgi:hypothetical protein
VESFKELRGQWDRVIAVVLTIVGGLLLILGWFGVSGKGLTSEQMPYIVSGGLGGIFLMGVGAALWLSADLRDEWIKLDRIETVLESGLEQLGLGRSPEGKPQLAPLVTPAAPLAPQVAARSASDDTEEIPAVTSAAARARAARPATTRASATRPRTARSAGGAQ